MDILLLIIIIVIHCCCYYHTNNNNNKKNMCYLYSTFFKLRVTLQTINHVTNNTNKKWTYKRFRQLDEGTLGCQKAQLVCRSRGMRGAKLVNDERRIALSGDVTSQRLPKFQH